MVLFHCLEVADLHCYKYHALMSFYSKKKMVAVMNNKRICSCNVSAVW